MAFQSITDLDRALSSIAKIKRGKVWCCECGRSERVDGSAAMRTGWPKCCGYTMTIDSPEERIALSQRNSK